MKRYGYTARFKHWLVDALFISVLTGTGTWVGATYYWAITSNGIFPPFYQSEFGPAVLEACGRGYREPSPRIPELTRFLLTQRTTFDCSELPERMPTAAPSAYQRLSRYWMGIVALFWKFRGVSWANLWVFFAVIHGATVALGYAAFRVALPPMIAAPLGFALAISPAQLTNLPFLRYSTKTPFFMAIAALVLLVWKMKQPGLRIVLILGTAFGCIEAIGFGFRPDVVTWFPPLLIAFFCTHHVDLKRRAMVTAMGGAAAIVTFVVLGGPILANQVSGSNFGHVAILGFSKPFDASLGVGGVPYSVAAFYEDSYVGLAVESYASRKFGYTGALRFTTPEYETYASRYLLEVLRRIPADVAIRTVSAFTRVLDLPFRAASTYQSAPAIEKLPYLHRLVVARSRVFERLDGCGIYLVLLISTVAAADSLIFGVGIWLTFVYLGAVPVIQFGLTHYAHLEFIGLLAVGLVVERALAMVRRLLINRTELALDRATVRSRLLRATAFASVIVVVPLTSIVILRGQQQRYFESMIATYDRTASDVPFSVQPGPSGTVLVVPAERQPDPRNPTSAFDPTSDYFIVSVADACDSLSVTFRIKYAATNPSSDFSRDVSISSWPSRGSEVTRLFVPVYRSNATRFEGFEVPAEALACVRGVKRAQSLAAYPIWFEMEIAPGWRDRPLYQRFVDGSQPTEAVGIYLTPPELVVRRRTIERVPPPARDFSAVSRIVKIDGKEILVDGRADGPFAYLATSQPRSMRAGTPLIAAGHLQQGGFTLGLIQEGSWIRAFNIMQHGPFIAALAAPADGTYTAVVANVNETTAPTQIRFDKLGFASEP